MIQNFYKKELELLERMLDTIIIRNYKSGLMLVDASVSLSNNIIVKDNVMSNNHYNNKRLKLARILILCGLTQGIEACSTHISMTEGVNFLVGETAHNAFNERAKINKTYQNSYESLDRDALQAKLDKEV